MAGQLDRAGGILIGYCWNVLPGESVDALCAQAKQYQGPVRRRLGWQRMPVGLWIARAAATELKDPREVARLRKTLADEGCFVYTLNGFPYGGFHAPRVKERVFEPSWADEARVAYTIDLAAILAELLPDDVPVGSISTVPLGLRVDLARARDGVLRAAETFGPRVELAIEPEPGAAFERVDALTSWLSGLPDNVGVCLDTCHAAVVGEDAPPLDRVKKVQVSSALVVDDPEKLRAFDEPRFLHQVRSDRGAAMDIPEALATMDRSVPWRVHFHVPLFWEHGTTRDTIAPIVRAARGAQIEVETYTWSVIPGEHDLIEGIAKELEWACALS